MSDLYTQLDKIPIIITLQYDGLNTLTFQVNPESLTIDRQSPSESANIEGIGEVSIPKSPNLATLEISSLFWQDKTLTPVDLFVTWLEKWQASKKPALLVVTRFNYSMRVTCEGFQHTKKAGEEKDVYFTLSMREYKTYGAKKINEVNPTNLIDALLAQNLTVPVLVAIPLPDRNDNKIEVPETYTAKPNDTPQSISKKFTGTTDNWKELYDNNKSLIANNIDDLTNIELEIPEGWR